MAVYNYDSNTGNLTTVATSGQRTWVGTKAQHDAAKAAGTLPNNAIIAITDDEVDNCHYSTDERETGMYWIDGKPIYRKVITYTATRVDKTEYSVGTIANLDTAIRYDMIFKASNGVSFWSQRYGDGNDYVVNWINNGNLMMRQASTNSIYLTAPIYVIVEYTKTTD